MLDLMIIPITLLNDIWEYYPDPFLSSKKRTIKNILKRIKLTKLPTNDYEFTLQTRDYSTDRFEVSDNLWRVMDSYTPWKTSRSLLFSLGLCKFVINNINYEAHVEETNYMQFKLWVSLSESWHVSAEQIGFNFYDISSPETRSDTKN